MTEHVMSTFNLRNLNLALKDLGILQYDSQSTLEFSSMSLFLIIECFNTTYGIFRTLMKV